jgi:hypothetical protein
MHINIRNAVIAFLIIVVVWYIATRPVHRGLDITIEGKPGPTVTKLR